VKNGRKHRGGLFLLGMAALIVVSSALLDRVVTGEETVSRALNRRAAEVTRMKNDFVRKVLIQKGIPHQVNQRGIVVRIQVAGKWEAVDKIEIIPVLRDEGQGAGIAMHEIYFTTKGGIYRIVSDFAIRRQ
jgi:hypothetical protein